MVKEYAIGETFRQGKVNLKVCEGLCIDCYFFSRPKKRMWEYGLFGSPKRR